MSDLISRSALMKEFETQTNVYRPNGLWHITGIRAVIEAAPTAYDLENVVKELEVLEREVGKYMNTKIYSVFPACGKTYLYEHQEDYYLKILDSDSSQFSWLYVDDGKNGFFKKRNPEFPTNYIKHIKENIGKYDYIFVSSHASVREELDKEGIDFTIVYPSRNCKAEWIGRCFIREKNGESGCGAEAMHNNWEQWITECFETGINHKKIVLHSNEYLSDCLIASL